MQPERLSVTEDQTELLVHWSEALTDRITASYLRANARDAASVRNRLENGEIPPPEGILITGLDAVGTMGVNVTFSDGHDRAIYPWRYLRELGAQKGN